MPYKDPAKQREALRRWRTSPKNRLKEASYAVDQKARSKSNATWNKKNHAVCLAAQKKFAALHPERVKATFRRWRLATPLMQTARAHRRRARKLNAKGVCSAPQLKARIALYGGLCWVPGCGKAYEAIDHVIPLAKGGSNWPSNLRPICTHHNSQKKDILPASFLGRVA